jgi:hypothetical protein
MLRGLTAMASSLAKITKSLAGKNKTKRMSVLYPSGSPDRRNDEAFAEPCCAESPPKSTFFETPQICRMRNRSSFSLRNNPRLTAEEFASLKEIRNRPSQRTIPDEHRDRLIEFGYVRAVVPSHDGVSALALTGRGLRRLALGK